MINRSGDNYIVIKYLGRIGPSEKRHFHAKNPSWGGWSVGYGRGGIECLEKELKINILWYSASLQREGIVFCEGLVRLIPVCYLQTLCSHGKGKVGRAERSSEESHSDNCAVVYECEMEKNYWLLKGSELELMAGSWNHRNLHRK